MGTVTALKTVRPFCDERVHHNPLKTAPTSGCLQAAGCDYKTVNELLGTDVPRTCPRNILSLKSFLEPVKINESFCLNMFDLSSPLLEKS